MLSLNRILGRKKFDCRRRPRVSKNFCQLYPTPSKFKNMGAQKSKLCKIHPNIYNYEPCVICLENKKKHSGCKRCKGCHICKKCFNQLVQNGNSKCPVCNLECEKCKNGENHEICTWSTRKNIKCETVIDIPNSVIAPLRISRSDREAKKSWCRDVIAKNCISAKRAMLLMSHFGSLLVLCFFIGLIIISCIHSGLKSDLTADLAFMCIGVGMLFIACLMCVCAAPCCCDYNVYACVKDLYFTD